VKDSAVPLCRQFIDRNIADAYELLGEDERPEGSTTETKRKPPKRLEPLTCESFDDLVEVFDKEGFHLSPNMVITLAAMIATNISVKLGRPFIWMYVQGPPSSGKSTLCEVLSADTFHCEAVDIFTGLHSGHRTKGKKGKDVSLLKLVDGKHWITKDWTATLTQPEQTLEKLYGQLRDAYDGTSKTKYGNDVSFSYENINFSMTAGCTDEILRHSHSHLGERFLLCDLTDEVHGSYKHVKRIFSSFLTSLQASYPQLSQANDDTTIKYLPPDRKLRIKRACIGFLDHLHRDMQTCAPPDYPLEFQERVVKMSQFIAKIRGKVSRDKFQGNDVIYVPRAEVAGRLSEQLGKLSMCLCHVYGKRSVDHEILDIIAKIASDTARGFNLDIVNQIMLAHNDRKNPLCNLGLDKNQIAQRLDMVIQPGTVEKRLKDLRLLKVVDNVKIGNNSNSNGRHKHLWCVRPQVRDMWNHLIGKKR